MRKFALLLCCLTSLFAQEEEVKETPVKKEVCGPEGWSIDLGVQYTWISLFTPPTYSGSTGGFIGKITYQKAGDFFGELRSIANFGKLSNGGLSSQDTEWYTEIVGGYAFPHVQHFRFTPYVGVGFDYFWDDKAAYGTVVPIAIDLNYRVYYGIIGLDFQYVRENWTIGLTADCMPTFNQTLTIDGLDGAAWTLDERVGFAIHLPVSGRVARKTWIELNPYYRLLPIGASSALILPQRNVNEWGAFLTLKIFM